MPYDRKERVAETMYYYGFNRDESARLASQIIHNLDKYQRIQDILFRMGILY